MDRTQNAGCGMLITLIVAIVGMMVLLLVLAMVVQAVEPGYWLTL